MIDLPTYPHPDPASIKWSVLDFGGIQQGPLGGSAQRVNRLGNRWQVRLPLPPMLPKNADYWESRLLRGLREGVRWRIIQATSSEGAGSPLVDGAGQSGNTLAVKGLSTGYWLRFNQPFSIVSGGKRYVHRVYDAQAIGEAGTATVDHEPPLRHEPSDEDVVEFSVPYLEGYLEHDLGDFTVDRIVNGITLTISEYA